MNKSVLQKITFYVEEDDNNRVDVNAETMNFTLLLTEQRFEKSIMDLNT